MSIGAIIALLTRRPKTPDSSPSMRFDLDETAPDNGHPEPGEQWWQYNARRKK